MLSVSLPVRLSGHDSFMACAAVVLLRVSLTKSFPGVTPCLVLGPPLAAVAAGLGAPPALQVSLAG